MNLVNRLLFRLTANRPTRLIKLDGRPYLERYYLGQWLGATFYLHRFVSSDTEHHLHNHPWTWGRALVLSGGYDEEVVTDLAPAHESGCLVETRRITWWNRVDGSHFHRIANAAPGTWTLFFHGPRVRVRQGMASKPKGWGFLERDLRDGEWATVFTPYPSSSREWWWDAPTGALSGREPL